MSITCALEIKNLTKTYAPRGKMPAKQALTDVSFSIPNGAMFALLGPNGAGKSTLINILAGMVRKTSGSVTIAGLDLDRDPLAVRKTIGIVPQELTLDPFFTPFEVMELQAGLYGVPKNNRRTMAILESLGLADKAHNPARSLSGGMRRRLMVAKALVHAPKILVLDEPTAGVDIELRRQLWEQVQKLNREHGTTVILTTHYMEEAQELCDTIAIINNGQLMAFDKKEVLLARFQRKTLTVQLAEPLAAIPETLNAFAPVLQGQQLALTFKPSETAVGEILTHLHQAGLVIQDIATHEKDLTDVFLEVVHQ